jgi:hypothetical protein
MSFECWLCCGRECGCDCGPRASIVPSGLEFRRLGTSVSVQLQFSKEDCCGLSDCAESPGMLLSMRRNAWRTFALRRPFGPFFFTGCKYAHRMLALWQGPQGSDPSQRTLRLRQQSHARLGALMDAANSWWPRLVFVPSMSFSSALALKADFIFRRRRVLLVRKVDLSLRTSKICDRSLSCTNAKSFAFS